MNYYDVLGVAPDASDDEIRKAYRELVEIHHPDRMRELRPNVQVRAGARLTQINEAYQVLRDPDERRRYDAALAQDIGMPEVLFKPKGNAGVARGRLRERLDEVEQQIESATAQIEQLRPRLGERQALDARWERYLFAALVLVWPFLLIGSWSAIVVARNPFTLLAQETVGLLLLAGYLAPLVVVLASRTPVRDVGWRRLLLPAPLAVLLFLAVVLVGLPRSLHLVALLAGYGGIVWWAAGQALTEARNHVLVAGSRIQRLEADLEEFRVERQYLRTELTRR